LRALRQGRLKACCRGRGGRSRREAAAQLISNHKAVVKFACRALGSQGKPVGAPLSDPEAVPNEDYVPLMDSALRCVGVVYVWNEG
jgi:glutathione S-transferase